MAKQEEKFIFKPDFLIIPGPVAFNKNLQPVDKTLYGVIYWLYSLKDGKCTASNAYLAKIVGCSSHSAQNSLTRLEKWKFLKRNYKDPKKKTRNQIIPLVDYRVSSNEDTISSNEDTQVSSKMGTDKEYSNTGKVDTVAAPPGALTDGQKDSPDKKDRPMNLTQFVEWCKRSPHAHIRIIGEWAETVPPEIELDTVAQWEAYIKRHLRPAKVLVAFKREQLEMGFEEIKKSRGWLKVATLETLFKFVTSGKLK